MSVAPPPSSRAAVWTVVAIVALPVLYLLSVPPVYEWNSRTGMPPEWVDRYCEPYDWLVTHTPLRRPLLHYADWWCVAWTSREWRIWTLPHGPR